MNIPPKIVMYATRFFECLSARCAIKKQDIPLNTSHTPIDIPFIYRCFLTGQWLTIITLLGQSFIYPKFSVYFYNSQVNALKSWEPSL